MDEGAGIFPREEGEVSVTEGKLRRKDVRDALIVVLAAMEVCPERFRDVFNAAGLPRSAWEALAREWIFDANDRRIFEMRYLDGMTHEKVAEAMSLSVDRVKARTKNVEQTLLKHM